MHAQPAARKRLLLDAQQAHKRITAIATWERSGLPCCALFGKSPSRSMPMLGASWPYMQRSLLLFQQEPYCTRIIVASCQTELASEHDVQYRWPVDDGNGEMVAWHTSALSISSPEDKCQTMTAGNEILQEKTPQSSQAWRHMEARSVHARLQPRADQPRG